MSIQLRLIPMIILVLCLQVSCEKCVEVEVQDNDILVFGHFYNMCIGESCVEIYKLEGEKLFEDTNDQYPGNQEFFSGNFVELGDDKYILVKDLVDQFPNQLLNESETIFGCPDCADQGGLYLEYKSDQVHKFWILDQAKTGVPEYAQEYMDLINQKIDLINE